jgi:hypothetical protein
MADMEVDPPAVKKEAKEDGKESKKRFEVKKVRLTRAWLTGFSIINPFSGMPYLSGPGVRLLVSSPCVRSL